jgi:hypothetical protein
MDELRVPPKLMDDRMGHEDGSVQARYSHVTPEMRRRLLADLTAIWVEALDARWHMHSRSPVGVLDRLLTAHGRSQDRRPQAKIISRISPKEIN